MYVLASANLSPTLSSLFLFLFFEIIVYSLIHICIHVYFPPRTSLQMEHFSNEQTAQAVACVLESHKVSRVYMEVFQNITQVEPLCAHRLSFHISCSQDAEREVLRAADEVLLAIANVINPRACVLLLEVGGLCVRRLAVFQRMLCKRLLTIFFLPLHSHSSSTKMGTQSFFLSFCSLPVCCLARYYS